MQSANSIQENLNELKLDLDALAESVSFWRLRRDNAMYEKFKAKYEAALSAYEQALAAAEQKL